ncbi:MAG: DUF1343 domain-containing protein [Flammeovirgaceae bacterium]|nr:DUF1343 domain-containing protein [Flammeovirgaceae bacterium]MDW8288083.1 DUF1343 domain-containing protein [Flammeovirgaceae bacterium]
MPSQTNIVSETSSSLSDAILVGAARLDIYLPLLHEKRVALVVNQTSIVGNTHLVDTLLAAGVRVKKVFAPEHGFRGEADAGELINTEVDKKTNLPLISLYGKNKKPTQEQLSDIDVVVFDIQDVGARFYTYISTMHYVMEACAEFQKTFVVLDRPNPNGFYVDGPVLDLKYRSFVGMHPIPIVHGLTVGELAQMIVGEKWISAPLTLHVIPCMNYTHTHSYRLPVRPSPNLTNDHAIRLYPSLCLFEGTIVSVGRGTPYPFQVLGAPIYKDIFSFSFTPQPSFGSKNPLYNGMVCYGKDLRNMTLSRPFSLSELIEFYHACPHKNTFFNDFFIKLAGTEQLRSQIEAGWSEEQIRASWQKELESYKKTRKKYLLYPDFE